MESLAKQRVLVTGGSRGLGLGIVEALVARGAEVTVVARTAAYLFEAKSRLGVAILPGDATDPDFAAAALRSVRPTVLVLNAGATPVMAPLHEQTWESFSEIWNSDVKAAFHWVQAALRLPLASASRVLIGSSGAAVQGSPLSGGYAGAKRMLWLMAGYANGIADELGLGIRFQAGKAVWQQQSDAKQDTLRDLTLRNRGKTVRVIYMLIDSSSNCLGGIRDSSSVHPRERAG